MAEGMAAETQNAQVVQTTLYTRGGPDMPDTRGGSMVAKHVLKLQKEKEEVAMKMVAGVVKELGAGVCSVALQECRWDAHKAIALLQRFKAAAGAALDTIHAQREAGKVPGSGNISESGSDSGSSSSDDSSSDASSDDSRQGKRKRHHRSRGSSGKRGRKDAEEDKKSSRKKRQGGDSDKDEKKKRKQRGKEEGGKDSSKAKRKESSQPVVQSLAATEFGKYGVIREADYERKRSDFAAWALEVRGIDVEVLPKLEERELFRDYMEDFNTCTLPHKKYYDMDAYAAKKAARAARKGHKGEDERVMFNDEEERRHEMASRKAHEAQERLKLAYDELLYTDKAQDMREQQMLRAQMTLAYKTGDHAKAARLAERLRPDDPRDPRKERDK